MFDAMRRGGLWCLMMATLAGCAVPFQADRAVEGRTLTLYQGAYGADGRPLRLIEQERRHMQDLWFSPEGPKKNQPLWSSLHYSARHDDGRVVALPFLDRNSAGFASGQMTVHALPGTNQFVAYGKIHRAIDMLKSDNQLPIFVRVFSLEKLVYETELVAQDGQVTFIAAVPALRFRSADGWKRVLLTERRIVAE
jgi:hypothetical protein